MKGILSDLSLYHDQAIVYCDSLSAIHLAKDQVHHEMTKHIDVSYHFLHGKKRIMVQKISIDDNPIDIFTKAVTHNKFQQIVWASLVLLAVDSPFRGDSETKGSHGTLKFFGESDTSVLCKSIQIKMEICEML